MYYAIIDEEGSYIHSGYNTTSKEDAKNDLVSLIEGQGVYIPKTIKALEPDTFAKQYGYTIDYSNEPFEEMAY